jgi:acetyl esterase
MPVDPQLVDLLRRVEAAPPLSSHGPEKAREVFRRLNALVAEAAPEVPVAAVEDAVVPGAAGPLRTRVYRPAGSGPHPTLVFFHGGGFTVGDLDSHDGQCRLLCREGGVVVLSTEYRLAPESPFPAAVEDALAATRWAADHVDELGRDGGRLAVGGDSAGGNLAAVVAQESRTAGPPLAAQLLIYPATDLISERPSHERNGNGYFLTTGEIEWFHANYLPDPAAGSDPRASPLRAGDLSGLPPAVIATAEFDPLLDDGDAYAEALAAGGVPVVHRRFDGLVHGFFGLGPLSESAETAIRRLCADLREVLSLQRRAG